MAADLTGVLVEISGVTGLVVPQSPAEAFPSKPAIDVNGKMGRVLSWEAEEQKYAVHLLEAAYVLIPAECLAEVSAPAAEDGGFDVLWPSLLEMYPDFADSVGQVLSQKNYCIIQMIAPEETRKEAIRQAEAFTRFRPLKEEFVSDYMGRGGKGKVGFLETDVSISTRGDALSLFDRSLTNLAGVFAPLMHDTIGSAFGDRTKGMLWLPYANAREEQALKPEPLNDDDVDEGTVAEHITFLQRRKLCLMVWLENEGGKLTLIHKPDLHKEDVELKLGTKKMLVFRSDLMTFRYEPVGRSVVLQSWLLEPLPEMIINSVGGDARYKASAMGLYAGRPFPDGDKVHVMAVNTRLPGGGFGPNEYWSMLLEGTDGEIPIPFLRWDVDIYCTKEGEPHQFGKAYAQHGGFCRHHEIYSFDNKFFDISDEETKNMSPGQRIMAEDGYTVMFRAGHTRESLNGACIGLFIGDTGSDWTPFNPIEYEIPTGPGQTVKTYGVSTTAITGGNNSVTCSRLSHIFNIMGPVATADTACSSSLVATGVAMSWLRDRMLPGSLGFLDARLEECVAGGVCVQIGPGSYIAMCGLNMISPVGRCFTFDESGDGYARGEGVGLMHLKHSENNDNDSFNQCACILGCCINQDGRSASMTAPNGPSQQACINASMREAGNEARDINLAECHGTGTALGDPIEVGALRNAMEPRDSALALTSSKSNIGHLEGGAGIAGLMKCILMLMAGTCPPNAHCRQLNPHLNVSGFPCYFDTEGIDTNLNSALTGVSSFGFGGTNGRCDIWGQAKYGVRKCGKLNIEELDQLTVTCPITMGPIDHITGEPAKPPSAERLKVKANVLREEFAPYDISRYAYTGGFRYRQEEVLELDDEDFPEGVQVCICGSWSAFTEMEEMDRQEDGWYQANIILGESRCELFDICLNRNNRLTIYPAINKADSAIWIFGPDDQGSGKKWMIDGRDMEVPAGTVYQVRFRWSSEKMQISWEEATDESAKELALVYEHAYYVAGAFSKGKFTALRKSSSEEGLWEGSFKIGSQGKEEFYLARDKDMQQLIYPSQHGSSSCHARGPDDLGCGKHFIVRGFPGEDVQVKLRIYDAAVSVVVEGPKGRVEWCSSQGWERQQYAVVGSLNDGFPLAMTMDAMKPGIFKCTASVGTYFNEEFRGFVETFQVAIDGTPAFYPDADLAPSGEAIVRGPDGDHGGRSFLIRSLSPEVVVEITLDLTSEDRRQIVTWKLVSGLSAIGV